MKHEQNVDAYIMHAPKGVQGKLRQIRHIIREVVPTAEERISYGMPYYAYHGRLAYFAYFTHHIGLYIPPPIIEDHRALLKGYPIARSTVRFSLDQDLPVSLITILLKARVAHNEL